MKIKKLVCGVGINDSDYVVQRKETIVVNGKKKQKLIWFCPFYRTWKNMLQRCYSSKLQERRPTYAGCSVSDDWKTFSNFRAWMMTQNWQDNQLDKDLLIEGNKVYSPETCVFVTQTVNLFTTESSAARGEFLIGVSWHKGKRKFQSHCGNPFSGEGEGLGYFDCEQEAYEAWLKRKLELAHELAAIQTDPRVATALIDRYTKYKDF